MADLITEISNASIGQKFYVAVIAGLTLTGAYFGFSQPLDKRDDTPTKVVKTTYGTFMGTFMGLMMGLTSPIWGWVAVPAYVRVKIEDAKEKAENQKAQAE